MVANVLQQGAEEMQRIRCSGGVPADRFFRSDGTQRRHSRWGGVLVKQPRKPAAVGPVHGTSSRRVALEKTVFCRRMYVATLKWIAMRHGLITSGCTAYDVQLSALIANADDTVS